MTFNFKFIPYFNISQHTVHNIDIYEKEKKHFYPELKKKRECLKIRNETLLLKEKNQWESCLFVWHAESRGHIQSSILTVRMNSLGNDSPPQEPLMQIEG